MEPSGLGIALSLLTDPAVLGLIVAGTVAGVIIGALPGLSSSMGVALLLPFSLYLDPVPAIALLSALYCAGTFGGSITAVLINAPGAPPAVATAFDGYPMALKGEAGRALGIAAVSSVSGGIISVLTLLLAAPLLARIAYSFGPPEYFALGVFALSMLASIGAESPLKNLIGGCLGLLIATVGIDLTTGVERFTFGVPQLLEGVQFIPVLIGLFAVTELLNQARHLGRERVIAAMSALRLPSREDFRRVRSTILRSSGIGVFVGVLPAEGSTMAAMIGYNEAKRWSKAPEEFGKGSIEGVAGPEAANNAATGVRHGADARAGHTGQCHRRGHTRWVAGTGPEAGPVPLRGAADPALRDLPRHAAGQYPVPVHRPVRREGLLPHQPGAADVSLAHGVRALPGRRVRPEPVHGGRVDHDRVGTCGICSEA